MVIRLCSLWLLFGVLAVFASGCQLNRTPPAAGADGQRYYTWVDEQGRVRQSPIQPEAVSPEQTRSIEEVVDEVRAEQVAGTAQAGPPETSVPAEASAPERVVATDEEPGEGATSRAPQPQADPEYNLSNYPDGNELAEAGFIREGDRLPYFTWRDAEGNIRVSYFQPDGQSFSGDVREEAHLNLTPASVHLASDQAPALPASSSGQLPEAFAVLGIEAPRQSYFQRWRAHCCDGLGLLQVESWQLGREFRVLVEPSSPMWPLLDGDSHYRLIQLPREDDMPSFVLRLKSFNRDGVFVPSLAFLDDSLQPLRVVTDLVPEYRPENWHRLGFLDIRVPAIPRQGERWLLIYTRESDVAGQTVIETERGPKAIPHTATGMLSLSVSSP